MHRHHRHPRHRLVYRKSHLIGYRPLAGIAMVLLASMALLTVMALADRSDHALADTGDAPELQYGSDGYFSTRAQGDKPVVEDGWTDTRTLKFGKSGILDDIANPGTEVNVSGNYKLLGIGEIASTNASFDDTNLPATTSDSTHLEEEEALLFADDVVTGAFEAEESGHVYFDSSGSASELAEVSLSATQNYSDFEQRFITNRNIEGVCTDTIKCDVDGYTDDDSDQTASIRPYRAFPLSAGDLREYLDYYSEAWENSDNIKSPGGINGNDTDGWWLRSPTWSWGSFLFAIFNDGEYSGITTDYSGMWNSYAYGLRPAIRLDIGQLILTSDAEDGSQSDVSNPWSLTFVNSEETLANPNYSISDTTLTLSGTHELGGTEMGWKIIDPDAEDGTVLDSGRNGEGGNMTLPVLAPGKSYQLMYWGQHTGSAVDGWSNEATQPITITIEGEVLSTAQFEFTVDIGADNASTPLTIPANGRGDSTTAYGVAYDWIIEISDDGGTTWDTMDCSTFTQLGGASCSEEDSTRFVGTSGDGVSRGPNVSSLSEGEHRIRLSSADASVGWLRAFGTKGSANHRTSSWITATGDIPFSAITHNDTDTEQSGDVVGYRMLAGTQHLSDVGAVLASDDASWTAVNIIGNSFFEEAFASSGVSQFADGSFDLSGIDSVGNDFFRSAFESASNLVKLPDDAFDTEGITESGDDFFGQTFRSATALTHLPERSFNTENLAMTGDGHFQASFEFAGNLTHLPDDSFGTSGITDAGDDFFRQTFHAAESLGELPDDSFDLGNILAVGNNFFDSAFDSAYALTRLPNDSFDTSRIAEGTGGVVGSDFFKNAFHDAGLLSALPDGSFKLAAITEVGDAFFESTFASATALAELPDGSFDTANIEVIGGGFFKRTFHLAAALAELPEGSFDFSGIQSINGTYFLSETLYGASSLTELPEGAFLLPSTVTVLPDYAFNATFSGDDGTHTPQLSRSSVLKVLVSWRVPKTELENTAHLFVDTFRNMTSATGEILVNEAAQLALNPSSNRSTFTGTGLCSNSYWYIQWGLARCEAPGPAEFTFAIGDVSKNLVIPARGVSGPGGGDSYSYGVSYSWQIERWDGSKWNLIPCKTSLNDDAENQSCVGDAVFAGESREGSDVGPQLGAPNTWGVTSPGSVKIRLTFSGDNETGWLRAFATHGHQSAPLLTQAGNIPFLAIKQHEGDVEQTGIYVAAGMFGDASNLSSIGTMLTSTDASWASIRKVGPGFFKSTFEGAKSLSGIGEGSFNLSALTEVDSRFFSSTFSRTASLTGLPANSFDTSKITKVGDYLFASTFEGATGLLSLPPHSFQLNSQLTDVKNMFFYGTFSGATALTALPDGSLNTSNIQTVQNSFFERTFNAATALATLPQGTLNIGAMTSVGHDFLYECLRQATALRFDNLQANTFLHLSSQLTSFGDSAFWRSFAETTTPNLPVGSLNTGGVQEVGKNFFASVFAEASIEELPDSALNFESLTSADEYFCSGAFYDAAELTSLGGGSVVSFRFGGELKVATAGFLREAFYQTASLTELPAESFNLDAFTSVEEYFLNMTFRQSGVQGLPDGSFNTGNIVKVGDSFMDQTFFSALELLELPEGAFNISAITSFDHSSAETVPSFLDSTFGYDRQLQGIPVGSFRLNEGLVFPAGASVFNATFSGPSKVWGAPQLSRSEILGIVSAWTGRQQEIQTNGTVFSRTFEHNKTATGRLMASEVPELLNSNTGSLGVRDTFKGTGLCSDSTNRVHWGLQECMAPFEFTLSVSDSTAPITIPANGRAVSDLTEFDVQYQWQVEWWNGSVWKTVPCTSALNGDAVKRGCDASDNFIGTSSDSAEAGPILTAPNTWDAFSGDEVKLRLSRVGVGDHVGWLRAFGTYGSTAHNMSGSLIAIGDIPFDAIKTNTSDNTRTGINVGYSMFSAATNLAAAGNLVDEEGNQWGGIQTVEANFLAYMFYDATALKGLSEDGEFLASDALVSSAVADGFLDSTFAGSSTTTAPQLTRAEIITLAVAWAFSDELLQDNSAIFRDTFKNVKAATGELNISDVQQLQYSPGNLRGTFSGTLLCSDTPYLDQWGLMACTDPGALPFTGSFPVLLMLVVAGIGIAALGACIWWRGTHPFTSARRQACMTASPPAGYRRNRVRMR